MRDIGNDETEVLLAEIEKRIGREYQRAAEDIEAKLNDYWRRFKIKDDAWQRMVANGTKTKQQYQAWRTGQLMVGDRWEGMKKTIATDLHNANTLAKGIVNRNLAEVYAANHNFTTFDIEKAAGVNTSFTLVDRDTVSRIIRDNPELLPPPSATLQKEFADFDAYKAGKSVDLSEEKRKAFDKLIADNKDIRWQEGKIQSVTLQSILQGESIPNMAKRIAQELGETNHKSTIRYARTAVTGAQNAGKEDAYRRAEAHGCKMKRVWRAVHDNRTRHEHRVLDGQIRGIDEPFEIDGYKIDFPADPKLAREAPYLYWNCRCYTRALIDGLEPQAVKYRPETIDGMTYDEWLNAKPKSRSITHQEEVAETMRRRTIRELYGGQGGGTGGKAQQDQTPTIAGVKRGNPMTHAEADTGRVNPHYSEGGGYRINCQSCVATYEARLRGYNVEVVSNDKDHPMCAKLAKNSRMMWKTKDGKDIDYLIGKGQGKWTYEGAWTGNAPTAKRFEKLLLDTLDDEGRYTLEFKWRGFNSGHIVCLQKDVTDLVIYDPQSDKTLRGKYVSDYLNRMQYRLQYKGNTFYQYPAVTRVDDKEFVFEVANEVMKKVGDK